MTGRWACVPLLCLAALATSDDAGAVAQPAATPYTIQFVFKGLVTLVPVGVTANGGAAKELWVLFPTASDTVNVAMQMRHMRNPQLFAMQNESYPAHHVLMALPKGVLAGAGLAESPPVLLQMDPRGTWEGSDLRMGGLPSTGAHQTQEWTYSEGNEPYRPLPVSVTVTSLPRTGDIQMSVGLLGSSQSTPFTIAAPKDGSMVRFEVTNAPAGELLDTQVFNPALTELEHFKLAYFLSPKPSNAADQLDYDYDKYIYPKVRKRPTPPGSVSQSNGDPFCTTPNRMQP